MLHHRAISQSKHDLLRSSVDVVSTVEGGRNDRHWMKKKDHQ